MMRCVLNILSTPLSALVLLLRRRVKSVVDVLRVLIRMASLRPGGMRYLVGGRLSASRGPVGACAPWSLGFIGSSRNDTGSLSGLLMLSVYLKEVGPIG